MTPCMNHPNVPAVQPCRRCGRPYCVDCLELIDHMPICKLCAGTDGGKARPEFVIAGIGAVVAVGCGAMIVLVIILTFFHGLLTPVHH